jgi:hypothetical protein
MFVGTYWTDLGVGATLSLIFVKTGVKNTTIVRYMIRFGSYCRGLMIVRNCHVIRHSVGSGWRRGVLRGGSGVGGVRRASGGFWTNKTFTDVPYRETIIRMKVICVYLRSLMRIWTSKHYIYLAILNIYGKIDHELEIKQPAEQVQSSVHDRFALWHLQREVHISWMLLRVWSRLVSIVRHPKSLGSGKTWIGPRETHMLTW